MVSFIYGSASIISPGGQAGNAAWIAVLLGIAEGLLIVWIFTKLITYSDGHSLPSFLQTTWGPGLGLVISMLYAWFCIHLASLVLRNFQDFIRSAMLTQTPPLALGLLIVSVCILAVHYGLQTIARCGEMTSIFTVTLSFSILVILSGEYDYRNLLPVLNTPISDVLTAAHSAAMFPFGETVVFLSLAPYIKSREKCTRQAIWAHLFTGAIFVLAVLRNTAVLGPVGRILIYPTLGALQYVEIAQVITRLELLLVTGFMAGGFIKITVLLFSATTLLAQVTGMSSRGPLIIPIAVLALIIAQVHFMSNAENLMFITGFWPKYAVLFELLLPGATLALWRLRQRKSNPRQG